MKRVKKYQPAEAFATFEQLITWCMNRGYVYWPKVDRPMHGSVIISMKINTVWHVRNQIRRAMIRPEWLAQQEQTGSTPLFDR